jgi:energy-coupling factor transporter ATP-binding protein EcfA2
MDMDNICNFNHLDRFGSKDMDLIINPFLIHTPDSRKIEFGGDSLRCGHLCLVTGDNLDHARAVALCALNFDERIIEGSGYRISRESKGMEYKIPFISYVSSNPIAEISRFTPTVRDELMLGLSAFVHKDEAFSRIEKAASSMGISELFDRDPAFLSGGETARVVLAAHLAREPKIWIIDQILGELDLTFRKEFFRSLLEYCKNNSAMAFVIDDINVLPHQENGCLWYVRKESVRINPPIEDIKIKEDLVVPDALTLKMQSLKHNSNEMALKIIGLSVLRSGRKVIDNLSFTCNYGQLCWIFGKNGAGKTTLLETLLGLSECRQGEIVFSREGETDDIFSNASYSPQHPDIDITESMLVDEIAFAHKPNWRIDEQSRDCAREWLLNLGIAKERLTSPIYYSLNQKKLASVLASFARKKSVVALDEPTLLLGSQDVELIATLIVKYVRENNLVMVATHDQRLISKVDELSTSL